MANTASQKKSDPKASSTADAGEAEVQARFDRETAQGYSGTVADPTPNHAYSVGGVTSDEPTPETDAAAAGAARTRAAEAGTETTGGGEGRGD